MKQKPNKIGTSKWHWFGRGMMGGLLLVAAANSASYFFRTGGISSLLNNDPQATPGAIGFPFEIWREGESYNGWIIDYSTLPWNVITGVILGCMFGFIGILGQSRFNQWVHEFEAQQNRMESQPIQFSLRGMLFVTTLFALVFAAISSWGNTSQMLAAIYFLGPLCLIAIAMFPNQIRWQIRVAILICVALGLIATAVVTGLKIGLTVDDVMLGIFVSWTPQSAFCAFLITVFLIIHLLRKQPIADPAR